MSDQKFTKEQLHQILKNRIKSGKLCRTKADAKFYKITKLEQELKEIDADHKKEETTENKNSTESTDPEVLLRNKEKKRQKIQDEINFLSLFSNLPTNK